MANSVEPVKKNPTPAIFLDRDGVLIEDAGYTKDPILVKLIPELASFLRWVKAKGFRLFVVTNQSGIGRAIMSLQDYQMVTLKMLELMRKASAPWPEHICFAPYYGLQLQHPESDWIHLDGPIPHTGSWQRSWRKPEAGMLEFLARRYHVDLSQSWIIGDKYTDQLLVHNASLRGGIWFYFGSAPPSPEEWQKLPSHIHSKIFIKENWPSVVEFLNTQI